MNREHISWYSERLGRSMDLLLYGHGGEPVLLFPTSKGRYFQNEDFGLVGSIADRIDAGRYVVACVDSVDEESWYDRGKHPHDRVWRHQQYESYLLHEVVPFLRSRSSGGRLSLGGASFGAFHTINIGLRHPTVFQRLIAMSGKFETESFLDGFGDDLTYFHSATQWIPNVHDRRQLEELYGCEIILAAGEHDICRESNEKLAKTLWDKGIGNHLAIWNGAVHDWPVWRKMAPLYLPW